MIERHGEPIGFFVPVAAKDRKAGREVLGRLGAAVEALVSATDLDEDELVDQVDRAPRRR